MKKRMMKIAACLMAASITFGSTGILTMAAGADVPLAGLQAKVEEIKMQASQLRILPQPSQVNMMDLLLRR